VTATIRTAARVCAVVCLLAPPACAGGDDTQLPPELRPLPWKRWALFDPILDPRSALFEGGYAALKSAATGGGRRGALRLAIGDGIRTEWGVPLLELERRLSVTATSPTDLLVQLPCYTLWGGLRLGPAELSAGTGLCALGVDTFGSGVAFSALSPSAAARATVVVGRVRVSALASIEYLWRWFGRTDLVVRALSFDLALVGAPAGRLGTHPVIVSPPPASGAED
jgi:hypothetical protein